MYALLGVKHTQIHRITFEDGLMGNRKRVKVLRIINDVTLVRCACVVEMGVI